MGDQRGPGRVGELITLVAAVGGTVGPLLGASRSGLEGEVVRSDGLNATLLLRSWLTVLEPCDTGEMGLEPVEGGKAG